MAAGVQQRLVRGVDLLEVVERLGGIRRRRLLVATMDDVILGSHAVGELDAIRLCRRYGLPLPDRQARRTDGDGRARWLDIYFDAYGLVVEVDGLWHMDVEAWWADLRRLNDHTIAGEALLRFPAFALREQPERVAGVMARALAARGWAGSCRLLLS